MPVKKGLFHTKTNYLLVVSLKATTRCVIAGSCDDHEKESFSARAKERRD